MQVYKVGNWCITIKISSIGQMHYFRVIYKKKQETNKVDDGKQGYGSYKNR